MNYDVIVIGLGPAGAHFSYLASKKGYNVLALERKTRHRYKTCAGGISPVSVKMLKESYGKIPTYVVERQIRKILLETNKNSLLLNIPKIEAFTTYRSKFDNWLINKAIDEGTRVKERCEIKDVKISSESVRVKFHEDVVIREATSKCLIGAYGARSSIQRILKLEAPRSVIAVQCELKLPKEEIDCFGDTLRLYYNSMFSKSGYLWIFPKKNYVTVGLLDYLSALNLKEKLIRFILVKPLARKKFTNSGTVNIKTSAALIPNETLFKTYGERIILIGDSAGFSDRITWEGISYALRSARYAVNTFNSAYDENDFSSNKLSEYQKMWKSCFGKDLRFGKMLQRMMFSDNLDENWSKAIYVIKRDIKLEQFLMNEMKEHMSLARAIGRLSLRRKISLLGIMGFKEILNLLNYEMKESWLRFI